MKRFSLSMHASSKDLIKPIDERGVVQLQKKTSEGKIRCSSVNYMIKMKNYYKGGIA